MIKNVLQYLELCAKNCPDKIALAMGDEKVSFSELRDLAKKRAILIQETESGKNMPVGVIANRSPQTIVNFMTVLYSGNFYVPIDPDMPAHKLQDILDDTCMKALLGSAENAEKLTEVKYGGRFLNFPERKEECTGQSASKSDSYSSSQSACQSVENGFGANDCFDNFDPASPLYMVYTSGSTGKPKGVLKSHGAMISFIETYTETFPFTSEEVIGNQTPFFFDASAKDLYLLLKTGGTMEIIPTELFSMPKMLIQYLNEKKITFCSWVPTALSIVAQLNPFKSVLPQYLKRMFFIGEVMPMKHLNKWRSYLPDVQYVNLYGQSEIAGVCCYYEVKGEFADTDTLPMGRPLGNCRVHLMKRNGTEDTSGAESLTEITEPGVEGEIFIESDALALEYYHDSEKTAKSFLTYDFGNGPVRCFRTGDLALRDASGNLVFGSRSDFQIKHMGHRIELGEIESVAGALPEIGRCCCTYNHERQKIVLFCTLADKEAEDSNSLTNKIGEEKKELTGRDIILLLTDKLSKYMMPSRVYILDRMPLNANGKIDRQALKNYEQEHKRRVRKTESQA